MISYDFHIHSCLSPCGDSEMTPNNIVNMGKLMGLDAIALSDHNSIGNLKAVMKLGESVGIKVIPGMEVETAEEVHVLTLFPDYETAFETAEIVYNRLPDIKNRPDIFGEQLYMNEYDEVVGIEEKLLITSTTITFDELFYLINKCGGMFIPAHVDRDSYSVLSNLGFIPNDLGIEYIELSKQIKNIEAYIKNRPDLEKYKILRNSDAHYLEDISEPINLINEDGLSIFFRR